MNWYESSASEKEIDEITAKRISNVHGSHDEEHANIRKTLLLILALQRPAVMSKDMIEKSMEYTEKLTRINDKIITIIEEGKKAKEDLL